MRIALFSDIHANLPALEACFLSMEQQKPDAIYCLGDLVGYNCWPNEVIHFIRRKGIPVIAGNYDEGVGKNSDNCGCAYKEDREREMGAISISYTNSMIGDDERQYLHTLPAHIRLDFQLNEQKLSVLLVHGSPRKINEYLFEDREERSMWRIMEDANADILCFGHTHMPFHRLLQADENGQTRYRHAINTGSVGKPKDGNPKGGYVMLTIHEQANPYSREGITVEFIRFDYDIEKAAKGVEASILPDEYAEMLRKGG